jgi:hypothetical protein
MALVPVGATISLFLQEPISDQIGSRVYQGWIQTPSEEAQAGETMTWTQEKPRGTFLLEMFRNYENSSLARHPIPAGKAIGGRAGRT